MGIYIKIHKMFESDNIGYYEVTTDDFGGCRFFVGMDKLNNAVHYYLTKDFSTPDKTISFDKDTGLIGELAGIGASVLGRVAIKALHAFKMDNFPDSLSYMA